MKTFSAMMNIYAKFYLNASTEWRKS